MNGNLKLVDDLVRFRTEEAMSALVAAARAGTLDADDLCTLAESMGKSGQTVAIDRNSLTADLASTGGPGSLSTLLAPLYLHAHGLLVPKLGVPGRPAGGIDVMAQLKGYRISLSPHDVREVIAKCGYAHFLAGEIFAPLDAAFFRYRQAVGAQDIPALAVASLLAKKVACGVKFAGLDVRVASHGNFGVTFDQARQAARIFCSAAARAGIKAVCILTDARTPYQPYLGRGEALLAMKLVFDGGADAWLIEHDDRCRLMAMHVVSVAHATAFEASGGDIKRAFVENVTAQGSSTETFEAKVDAIANAPRRDLTAPRDGFLKLDLSAMRSVFVAAHAGAGAEDKFPDKIGLILRARPGKYVRRGDLLASVRADEAMWSRSMEGLSGAFQVVDLLDYAPGLEEIVRG